MAKTVILLATTEGLEMLNNTIRIVENAQTQQYMQESIIPEKTRRCRRCNFYQT